MRHIVMIVTAFALAQGTALADGLPDALPDVPPPPASKPVNSCPAPTSSKEYQELLDSLHSTESDLQAFLKDGCNDDLKKKICEKHPDWEACKPPAPRTTTTTVVRRPPHHPKAPKVELPPSYIDIEKVDATGDMTVRCVRLTKWEDRNHNGKHDADETVQTDQVCDGHDGAAGINGTNGHSAGTMPGSRFKSDPNWCSGNGGTWIDGYVDLNDNGKPDKGESTGHVGASCDLPPLKALQPHDGRDGRPGHDGTTVAFGSLVTGDLFRSQGVPSIRSSSFGLTLMLEHDWAEAAVSAGWSPGIDHGAVLEADFSAFVLWNRIGPRIGAELVYADIDSHNRAKYQMMALTPGIAVRILDGRHWKMRAEAHVGLGLEGTYSQFQRSESVGGSLSLSYGF